MASMASIELDFRMAMQQADKIESIALNLNALADTRFGGVMQTVSSNWKGGSAALYLRKGEQLQRNIRQTAAALRGIAGEIRTEAERLRKADLAALAIVQK